MDFRARIIELLQIGEGRIDCDAGFFDDTHYRRLYLQATKKRDLISSENKTLVGIIRKRLSEPPVSLSSTRIMDRYASPNGLILTAKEAHHREHLPKRLSLLGLLEWRRESQRGGRFGTRMIDILGCK